MLSSYTVISTLGLASVASGVGGNVSMRNTHLGFSLVETMMVVAIGVILLAMTTVSVNHAVEASRGDGALFTVMSQLRTARAMAINRRRSIQVQFNAPNELVVTRFEVPTGTTLLNQVFLEGNMQFLQFSGLPDTPDGFGAAAAVAFDGQTPTFTAEGMSVDATGAPLSGTLFLGIQNEVGSARAVTVFGGTGQVRGYAWTGNGWVEQ